MNNDSDRPAKRIRQACEQCRRKKSKCSGERPVCSTCWRLEQQCFYYGEPLQPIYDNSYNARSINVVPHTPAPVRSGGDTQNLDDRMVTLESTVNKILGTLQSAGPTGQTYHQDHPSPFVHNGQDRTFESATPPLTAMITTQPGSRRIRSSQRLEIEELGRIYMSFCADQPLPLFQREGFIESLLERSDASMFAIIANSLRYKYETIDDSHIRESQSFRDAAHVVIMKQIGAGNVGVTTLQALCLVAFFDFATGCIKTASSLVALASTLASSADFGNVSLASHEMTKEERTRCYWSIVVLQRLLGIVTPFAEAVNKKSIPYPESCSMPSGSVLRPEFRQAYERSSGDNGVMVFVIEMSEEWTKVMAYVRDCLSFTPDVSPWLTTSRYTTALAGVMSIESRLHPGLHRYKHITFRDLKSEDLERCREYWAPWLLSRFLYHTMICLLNHPLLITLQLQAKGNDSELFRQQSSFYVARHVHWILHFIAFIEDRHFRITDPILGYSAAVVATIESQLIYSVDHITAQKKRRNIESCRRLIRSLATSSNLMAEMDRKLGALDKVISTTYASNITSAASVSVDLTRVRDILDICPATHFDPCSGRNDPEPTPQATGSSGPSPSQWVRLSRRPSVDQPDEGGSPGHDENQSRPHDSTVTPIAAMNSLPVPENFQNEASPAPFAHSGFPADLFFNGISQDVSSWWHAFDTYDPDCPSF